MSSLKHSVHRRVHLERATPVDRLRFGILERKKDYKVRAKRYHEKENLFRSLSEKARTRNPEEFDFGMVNSKLVNGRYKKMDSKPSNGDLTSVEKKLAESQNLNYVNFRKSIDDKKIERLEKELSLFGQSVKRNHILFDPDDDTATNQIPQGRNSDTLRTKTDSRIPVNANNFDKFEHLPDKVANTLTKSYKILNDTIARSRNLGRVSKHLELQKNLQSKGKKKKVLRKDGNFDYVWFPKRKK
ncbi:U3 small nucleolar RNA-associated protein 11 [Cryptosporidium felis]|nr:U3 small nucleolar RNA-associated protein 11 [Cryptosporidium felis]